MTESRCCPYCQQSFHPSPYRLQQRVCSQPERQRHRRADYHRLKIQTDAVYAQVVQDSRKQWRAEHADYQKTYWRTHPEAADRNRQRQRQLHRQRRVTTLVKNNAAVDLKHSAAEVWLVGPGHKWELLRDNSVRRASRAWFRLQPVSRSGPVCENTASLRQSGSGPQHSGKRPDRRDQRHL